MTITAILTALEDYLRPLVLAEKGILSVAETAEDAMELLSGDAPTRWRVVLSTDGEKAPENDGRAGHVINDITVYVQAPKDLDVDPGKGIHRNAAANSPAFLARLGWVIRKLRAVRFDDDEIDEQQNLNYRGWTWLKYQDALAWRAAKITFELLFVLDDPFGEASDGEEVVIVSPVLGGFVPPGGTVGQMLIKASSENFDTAWANQPEGGGTGDLTFGIVGGYLHITQAGVTKRIRLLDL